MQVKPKKHLGQHFLKDQNIAEKIAKSITMQNPKGPVLEIGPGTGVLTKHLIDIYSTKLEVIEIDKESVEYLKENFKGLKIHEGDFLKIRLDQILKKDSVIIGNFPYNISSQIFFKVLEHRDKIPEAVGMIQKEVAQRIASIHGNKQYGILSVLLQLFYKVEYLFTVHEHVFVPPPKVKSAVIRLTRKGDYSLECDEKSIFRVVKQGFNNRRKTLRNALKSLNLPPEITSDEVFNKRAEQLSVQDFVELTIKVQAHI